MKKLMALVVCAVALAGCVGGAEPSDIAASVPDRVAVQSAPVTEKGALDDICGDALPPCDDGLVCVKKQKDDANFVCKVRDLKPGLECDAAKWELVCAARDGVENTYQNECYAAKGGATVVSSGKCP